MTMPVGIGKLKTVAGGSGGLPPHTSVVQTALVGATILRTMERDTFLQWVAVGRIKSSHDSPSEEHNQTKEESGLSVNGHRI
jgi:hypothetical protein